MKHSLGNRIGVFDSGVGGVTVLRKLYRHLPEESMLYFADTQRLPYGSRSPEEIILFVRQILDWMEQQQVKMVIMACNTSSALALETVKSEYNFPILGLINPVAKGVVSEGQRVGVISTVATAKSNAYLHAIRQINSYTHVWQVGCPEFVPLIENNRIHDPYTKKIASEYLKPLIDDRIDSLIYGCTHYPHLQGILRAILPESVKLIDPADYVVTEAKKQLDLLSPNKTFNLLPTRFCVSGNPEDFAKISKQWLGFTPNVEQISLSGANNLIDLHSNPEIVSVDHQYSRSLTA